VWQKSDLKNNSLVYGITPGPRYLWLGMLIYIFIGNIFHWFFFCKSIVRYRATIWATLKQQYCTLHLHNFHCISVYILRYIVRTCLFSTYSFWGPFIFFIVVDPHWFQCGSGSGSSILGQCGSGYGVLMIKIVKFYKWFKKKPSFLINILIYFSIDLDEWRPSYWRRSLQPSIENIQHFKTWNFFFFYFSWSCLPFWFRTRIQQTKINANTCGDIKKKKIIIIYIPHHMV